MILSGDAPPGDGTEDEIFGATGGPPVKRPRHLAPRQHLFRAACRRHLDRRLVLAAVRGGRVR